MDSEPSVVTPEDCVKEIVAHHSDLGFIQTPDELTALGRVNLTALLRRAEGRVKEFRKKGSWQHDELTRAWEVCGFLKERARIAPERPTLPLFRDKHWIEDELKLVVHIGSLNKPGGWRRNRIAHILRGQVLSNGVPEAVLIRITDPDPATFEDQTFMAGLGIGMSELLHSWGIWYGYHSERILLLWEYDHLRGDRQFAEWFARSLYGSDDKLRDLYLASLGFTKETPPEAAAQDTPS